MDVWENEGGAVVSENDLTPEEQRILEEFEAGEEHIPGAEPEQPSPGADWQEPVDQHMYPEDGADVAD